MKGIARLVISAALLFGPALPAAPLELRAIGSNDQGYEVFSRGLDHGRMVKIPACGEAGTSCGESEAFLMDEVEVTQRRYLRFVQETGAPLPVLPRVKPGDDHPAVGVPWGDAAAYCHWVGARLPTAREWQRAAGLFLDGRVYPWGSEWQAERVNAAGEKDGWGCTAPVGSLAAGASPFGILDLSGNAQEWVADEEERGLRQARGGSWRSAEADELRLDRGVLLAGDDVGQWLGFRCAADLPALLRSAP